MATAKIEMKEVPTVKLEKRVVLELSLEEAATLQVLMGAGTGNEHTANIFMVTIYRQLKNVLNCPLSSGSLGCRLEVSFNRRSKEIIESWVKENS